MNYVITVYRTQGNAIQNFNASSLPIALAKFIAFKNERFVRKIELSVLLETWEGPNNPR